MEENVAVESVEVTTPDAVTDTAESPADAETMGEIAETQSTEPATEGGEGTTPPSEAAEEATPITVPVRYRHESRALTLACAMSLYMRISDALPSPWGRVCRSSWRR